MDAVKIKIFSWIDGLRGRVIHASWLAVLALVALTLADQSSSMIWAGLACAALPGLLGVLLLGPERSGQDSVRFIMALAWVLPGISATLAFADPVSPAALVFLAGPAAMAASGGRNDARFSALLSAIGFVLVFVTSLFGPVGSLVPALASALEPWAAFAGFLAFCGMVARARIEHQLDGILSALGQTAPAADGFARAPNPLVALNMHGKVVAASRSLRRLTPGVPRNLDGLDFDGLAFDDGAREQVRAGLASAQLGGEIDGGRFTFEVRGARGEARSVDARAVATPAGFVVALERAEIAKDQALPQIDIEALAQERDAAIAANRSKSQFLAAVSHELRTPLNAIIGFSDVMKQRLFGPLPARYAEYGDLIHESGTHLLDLIGDVLDMSKIEADRYELVLDQFDARDVVDISAKMMRLRAEESGLALYCDTGEAEILVDADRKAMRQILLNLLSNALKFTPEGGAVVVMARAEGSELVLAVGDSGVGMSEAEVTRLGQPFTQVDSAQTTSERGTGLGISLVRALTELQGGSMHIESAPGEGTTITVRLPVLEQPTGAVTEFETLDVHERIRAAQSASAEIASQASA